MLVETYEVPEVDHEGQVECEPEAIALIESLGLGGQQKLILRREGSNKTEVERMPYRRMTAEEAFTYSRICPKDVELRQYEDGPIPLRVLQVASHAKDYFDSLHVWCPKSADEKDPVLVGINGRNTWDTDYARFILARWGEVLEPFADCMAKAARLFRDELKAKVATCQAELRAAAESIDEIPDSQLVGKSIPYVGGV